MRFDPPYDRLPPLRLYPVRFVAGVLDLLLPRRGEVRPTQAPDEFFSVPGSVQLRLLRKRYMEVLVLTKLAASPSIVGMLVGE